MKTIGIADLEKMNGGMRTDKMRLSTNIEDRRSKAAIIRDTEWWQNIHRVPLPPRRPKGI